MIEAYMLGTVKNGAVILDKGSELPEGTRVIVQTYEPRSNGGPRSDANSATLVDDLLAWAGQDDSLPEDGSKNHDHYLYGRPKK